MTEKSGQSRNVGDLISEALARREMSVRAAARKVGMSDSRLRQIIKGRQPVGRGEFIAVYAPEDTLAKISLALGISPEELESAGRPDAAWSLRRRLPDLSSPQPRDRDLTWRQIMADHDEIQEWAEDPTNFLPPDVILTFFSSSALLSEAARRLEVAESILGSDWVSDWDDDVRRIQVVEDWNRRRDIIEEVDRHVPSGQRRPSDVDVDLIDRASAEVGAAVKLSGASRDDQDYVELQVEDIFRQLVSMSRLGSISTADALAIITHVRDAVAVGRRPVDARSGLWVVQVALMDFRARRQLGPAYVTFQTPSATTTIEQLNHRVQTRLNHATDLTDALKRDLLTAAQEAFTAFSLAATRDEAATEEMVRRATVVADAVQDAQTWDAALEALRTGVPEVEAEQSQGID